MIDIHTHLLPGVDDGSPSVEASVPILEQFGVNGVEVVVCTPHLRASAVSTAPHEEHQQVFDRLVAAAPAVPRLARGWEIMLDVPGVDFSDRRLGLDGSSAVLVEFSTRQPLPPTTSEELRRIRSTGAVPVIAHPERYRDCTRELVEEWRSAGARIQMDVPSIFGSARLSALAETLLAAGLVDLFASDTHVDRRSLAIARTWLTEVAEPVAVDLLLRENARRLLANESTIDVPPIHLKRDMFQRLRELVLGRP